MKFKDIQQTFSVKLNDVWDQLCFKGLLRTLKNDKRE